MVSKLVDWGPGGLDSFPRKWKGLGFLGVTQIRIQNHRAPQHQFSIRWLMKNHTRWESDIFDNATMQRCEERRKSVKHVRNHKAFCPSDTSSFEIRRLSHWHFLGWPTCFWVNLDVTHKFETQASSFCFSLHQPKDWLRTPNVQTCFFHLFPHVTHPSHVFFSRDTFFRSPICQPWFVHKIQAAAGPFSKL